MEQLIHLVKNLPVVHRPRRLRETPALRRMVRETRLDPCDFIHPMFVVPGKGVRQEIPPMPGNDQVSVDLVAEEAGEVLEVGVPAVMLFGIPDSKDEEATGAWAEDGIIQRAIRALKEAHPELVVIADTCLCEYMSHGHCGVVTEDGRVDNDLSVEILAKTAVSQARAGADLVAPSDMMDGRVGAIRAALDEERLTGTPIVSYAAKYASCFYGPFRVAAESAPAFGDRRSYQMDPPNVREALREVELDVAEGADIVMVKPALPYLDVICRVRDAFDLPVAAYNVSGEFAMVKAAGQNGWIDGQAAMMEVLTSIKRAGADLILTYFAKDAARLLKAG
ncbi:MAG: porphobilinogen synthase [Nitrospinota bacterium]